MKSDMIWTLEKTLKILSVMLSHVFYTTIFWNWLFLTCKMNLMKRCAGNGSVNKEIKKALPDLTRLWCVCQNKKQRKMPQYEQLYVKELVERFLAHPRSRFEKKKSCRTYVSHLCNSKKPTIISCTSYVTCLQARNSSTDVCISRL